MRGTIGFYPLPASPPKAEETNNRDRNYFNKLIQIIFFGILLVLQHSAFSQDVNKASEEIKSSTSPVQIECPEGMVSIDGRFCIDRYEYPNIRGQVPLAGVTWLEAAARCREQGKTLCSGEQWSRACSGAEGRPYAYGTIFDRRKCYSGRKHYRKASPSGQQEECVTPEGVYDLSGNLWEWTGRTAAEAALAGGCWMSGEELSRCDSRAWVGVPTARNFTFGFRCCLGPEPEDKEP
jgi:formylglycine-generating enzyme required for sulfatase activity